MKIVGEVIKINANSSEIILGLITTLGTDTNNVIRYMREHLSKLSYTTEEINVSSEILNEFLLKIHKI